MIPARIDQITPEHILSLVTDAVREGKTIEYKEQLPGNSDGDKKEFLADVSSFANATGGYIIYGVVEIRDGAGKATGIPEQVPGLIGINADIEVRRLEQIIRSGLEPQIPGVVVRAIDGFAKGPAIVIRIPQSWLSPHMVTFKASHRFFSRTSAGKSPLSVPEIRSAFVQSEVLSDRIRNFRERRLSQIVAGETPVRMTASPAVVLHLVPVTAFLNPLQVDVLAFLDGKIPLGPMGAGGWDRRLNLDGYVAYQVGASDDDQQFNYVQLFRNGIIEAVDTLMLTGQGDQEKYIPSVAFERDILRGAASYFNALRTIGSEVPM